MSDPRKKRLAVIAAFFLVAGMSCALWGLSHRNAAHTTENPDAIVYVPGSMDPHIQHPLVIVLSPSGDAPQMIETWKGVAEKFKWIILSSKKFHNGISGQEEWRIFKDIAGMVQKGVFSVAIDRKKVLASGFSGGGMGAHHFSFFFPKLICGVIVNTGMMDWEYSNSKKNEYPLKKVAVFLASPTDFRYNEMKRDQGFLKNLGWKTQWIEFQGGHALAPQGAYFQAARWIAEQWSKPRLF